MQPSPTSEKVTVDRELIDIAAGTVMAEVMQRVFDQSSQGQIAGAKFSN